MRLRKVKVTYNKVFVGPVRVDHNPEESPEVLQNQKYQKWNISVEWFSMRLASTESLTGDDQLEARNLPKDSVGITLPVGSVILLVKLWPLVPWVVLGY
jgi:hypothetical protein